MKAKVDAQPHEQRRGPEKWQSPRGLYQGPPMWGKESAGDPLSGPGLCETGRCRFHGGKSTGPRTPEGMERMRKTRTKHGLYAAEAIELRRLVNMMLRRARGHLRQVAEETG